MRNVTIKEIASEMGLSRNTVAKALADSDVVSYGTKCAVIEKAKELGYQKLSPTAKNLLNELEMQRIKTILVLAYAETSVFWNEIILGISEELKEHGYKLRFNFISKEDEVNQTLPIDWEDEASGVILLSVFTEAFVKKIEEKKIPMIFLDCPTDASTYMKYGDVVVCEGKDSVRRMVQTVIGQGITDFSFVGDITYCKSIHERYEGFRLALEQAGLMVDQKMLLIKHVPGRYYEYGEVASAIQNLPRMPKAFVCANDDIAQSTIRYLKSEGYRIPEDIAITGYDNLESISHVEPFLTTVNVENQLLGKRLVQQLLFRFKHAEFKHELIYVGTDVIYRTSTKK